MQFTVQVQCWKTMLKILFEYFSLLSYEHSCGFYLCAFKISNGLYRGQIINVSEMPLQLFLVKMFKCMVYKMFTWSVGNLVNGVHLNTVLHSTQGSCLILLHLNQESSHLLTILKFFIFKKFVFFMHLYLLLNSIFNVQLKLTLWMFYIQHKVCLMMNTLSYCCFYN